MRIFPRDTVYIFILMHMTHPHFWNVLHFRQLRVWYYKSYKVNGAVFQEAWNGYLALRQTVLPGTYRELG